MGHLRHFGLENFRTFKNSTQFELAPITILTGRNSSGKSSLIKALVLLKDSFKSQIDCSQLLFSLSNSNLGDFNNAISWETKSDVIKFKFNLPNEFLHENIYIEFDFIKQFQFKEDGLLIGFRIYCGVDEIINFENDVKGFEDDYSYERRPVRLKINVDYFNNYLNNLLLSLEKKKNEKSDLTNDNLEYFSSSEYQQLQIEKMAKYSSVFYSFDEYKKYISNLDKGYIYISEDKKILDSLKVYDKLFTITKEKDLNSVEEFHEEVKEMLNYYSKKGLIILCPNDRYNPQLPIETFKNLIQYFHLHLNFGGGYSTNIEYTPFGSYIFKNLIAQKLIDGIYQISTDVSKLNYISSNRASYDRAITSSSQSTELNGLIVRFLKLNIQNYDKSIIFINDALRLFGIGEELIIERNLGVLSTLYLLKDKKKVILTDVGFGISQLIPIILHIAIIIQENKPVREFGEFSWKPSILIIEEPESNLHPSYQSKLSELFYMAANNFNIQFIIETHSEYLIRKLQRLVAQKVMKPNDIALYYFYPPNQIPKDEEQIIRINFMENGYLNREFGTGFFDEADNLALDLFIMKSSHN